MNPASARYVVLSAGTPGRRLALIRRDIERDRFLTAEEANEYGLVDEVLTSRKEAGELALLQ